jgi:Lrp/AsnC family leucine-responsive transcriptional regulator
MLLRVQVPSIESLEGILDQFLLYGQTTSSFIVSTPVTPRAARPTGVGLTISWAAGVP